MDVKELAEWLHDNYEEIAIKHGWQTQKKTRVDFDNLPETNKKTMLELSVRLITKFKEGVEPPKRNCGNCLYLNDEGPCDTCGEGYSQWNQNQ